LHIVHNLPHVGLKWTVLYSARTLCSLLNSAQHRAEEVCVTLESLEFLLLWLEAV
jgi:hypothetical protein